MTSTRNPERIPSPDDLKEMTVAKIAWWIGKNWSRPYYGAVPYIEAMQAMEYVNPKGQHYGADQADHVIMYFLSNASTWRGELARSVKAELRARCS